MNNLILSDETAIAPSEVFMDGESITEFDLESTCTEKIREMYQTGSTEGVEQAILNLNGVEKFAAKAKAKLIYAWSKFWLEHNPNGDFAEMYIQTKGGDKLTVQKHTAVGELLMSEDVPTEVKQLSTKELIPVARAIKSGYDFSEVWDEIKVAGSESEVNDIVRRVRGKEKRAGSLTIVVHPDGSMTGHEDGVHVFVGVLNFADRDSKETSENKKKILEKSISRIIKNTGMLEE